MSLINFKPALMLWVLSYFYLFFHFFSVLQVLVQFLSNAYLEKWCNKPSPLMCFMFEYIRSNIVFLINLPPKIYIYFLFELTCCVHVLLSKLNLVRSIIRSKQRGQFYGEVKPIPLKCLHYDLVLWFVHFQRHITMWPICSCSHILFAIGRFYWSLPLHLVLSYLTRS